MCPSRLPNEVSSYRPSGMLDRDQRTTFTIHRIRGDLVNSSPNSTSHRNSRPSSNHHQCNVVTSKEQSNQMGAEVQENNSGSSDSRCRCNCQEMFDGISWQDRSFSSIRQGRRYTATSGYYRSRTKFVNYLLGFICIWLVTIHGTCAYPAMSNENLQDPDAQRCRRIKDALEKPLEQTILASGYMGDLANDYTQAQFNMKPADVHKEWINHAAHFNYGTFKEKFLPEDFDDEPSMEHFQHLLVDGVPTEDELSMEFERIYVCLQTLKHVFHSILEDRETNKTQIMHHLNNDRSAHEKINKMFVEQFQYSNLDIAEVESAMRTLQIPFPELTEVKIAKKERILGEWLATREYLKVLGYMRGVYRILRQRCS